MTVVVDASTIVAVLVDAGRVGTWAEAVISHSRLAGPELVLVEACREWEVSRWSGCGRPTTRFAPVRG